jgi:hypothetical protein
MQSFEGAFQAKEGWSITGLMQDRWQVYMTAHLTRVQAFARFRVLDRLTLLENTWAQVMRRLEHMDRLMSISLHSGNENLFRRPNFLLSSQVD